MCTGHDAGTHVDSIALNKSTYSNDVRLLAVGSQYNCSIPPILAMN